MIVLNLQAIPVFFIALIVGWFMNWLMPDFMEGTYGPLAYSIMVFVVGGVTEMMGLAGRVFWLPIWFLGLLATGYQAWDLWGLWGVGVVGVLVAGFVGLLFWGKHMETKRWAAAPDALNEAQLAWQVENLGRTWAAMEKCFCTNVSNKYDTGQSEHNAKVLELLLEIVGGRVPPHRLSYIEGIRERFNEGAESAETVELPYEMVDWVARYIRGHGVIDEEPPEEEAEQIVRFEQHRRQWRGVKILSRHPNSLKTRNSRAPAG